MKVEGKQLNSVKKFQQERSKFYLLTLIANNEGALLYSDLDSYIIGRSREGLPIWIWTSDDITPDQVIELENELNNFFAPGKNQLTCKKELFDKLNLEYDTDDYFEMGFLSCHEVTPPMKGIGIFVRPDYTDKVTLAEYWRANAKEMYNEEMSQNDALEQVEAWLEGKRFYVLKNNSGEIVTMAGYSTVENMAKLTHAYTPKKERGKGYCQYLIYKLTKKLLDEGYLPVLYTDYHYPASNKAYKNVGYEDGGYLINFSIEQQKIKNEVK